MFFYFSIYKIIRAYEYSEYHNSKKPDNNKIKETAKPVTKFHSEINVVKIKGSSNDINHKKNEPQELNKYENLNYKKDNNFVDNKNNSSIVKSNKLIAKITDKKSVQFIEEKNEKLDKNKTMNIERKKSDDHDRFNSSRQTFNVKDVLNNKK